MLKKRTLMKFIKDSISSGTVTEELQKALDTFYLQLDNLKKDHKYLQQRNIRLAHGLQFYAIGCHVRAYIKEDNCYGPVDKNGRLPNGYLRRDDMVIECGKVARETLSTKEEKRLWQ